MVQHARSRVEQLAHSPAVAALCASTEYCHCLIRAACLLLISHDVRIAATTTSQGAFAR